MMANAWERYPELDHLSGEHREQAERRRRHRQVRYLLYSLQRQREKGEELSVPVPGFVEFWLCEKPEYCVGPNGDRGPVPDAKQVPVHELGGYRTFAKAWDVDADLIVYLRHASVWQEWNATLARVVPILGDD